MKLWPVIITTLFSAVAVFATPPALIPLPQQMQLQSGTFTLCPAQLISGAQSVAPMKILVDNGARETGEYLAGLLFKSTGYRFQIASNPGGGDFPNAISLTTNSALAVLGSEGYELTVATNSVVIRAPTSAGLFYGVQTLLQLLPPEIYSAHPALAAPVAWSAPCVYIQDSPRFPWRGWMLDSVRHFFNKDEVKQMLDTMAFHKLNMFHWHLDDDSGWRIEILKWPLLTQVGAWRTNLLFNLNPRSTTAYNDLGEYGGFYTQADVREIVAYAAQRHITIIPEIEMPGHSSAPLAAYPQFSCNGGVGDCTNCLNGPYSLNVTSYSGGVFCAARPETKDFLHDILTEVIGLFPGPYIHIGGDEVRFNNWTNHSLDLALITSLGFTNSTGVTAIQKYQSYFTQQIANWIKSQGRTMIGWSEIMNGGLVTNAVLMDWLATKATFTATNGQYAVMSPSASCYINKWETGSTSGNGAGVIWSNEPPAQSGFVSLNTAYSFEPIPAGLAAGYTNFILGSQGNSWSEWIPSLLNMQFRVFPRLCALAEGNWTPAALKNYSDFTNRLVVHKQRLTQMGVNYNPSATPPAIASWIPAQVSTNYNTLSWNLTSSVTAAGEIDLSFCWQSGANGLDIAWVALLENGVEIDRDTHAGFTGVTPVKPTYILRLPARRNGSIYTIQASVAGRGGSDSTGTVYRPNWN